MRFVDEYRNEADARKLLTAIERTVTRPWTIMEICGGQTHTLIKSGIDRMLPPDITLVHGPGCPVCVTPLELIDKAIAIARRPEVILTSFGDMLRVPGSGDRSAGRAGAGRRCPHGLLAAGCGQAGGGTPGPAGGVLRRRLRDHGARQRDGRLAGAAVGAEEFLDPLLARAGAAGHGSDPGLARQPGAGLPRGGPRLHGDGLLGIRADRGALPRADRGHRLRAAGPAPGHLRDDPRPGGRPLGRGEPVRPAGDARREPGCPTPAGPGLRGVRPGLARHRHDPASGYRLRPEFAAFDAEQRFGVENVRAEESPLCIAGQILRGQKKPHECSAFGAQCTPEHPLGAPMVSSEGACAAYYSYGRAE